MSEKEIKNSPELKNWKVKRELLRLVNIECATLEITQYELADIVWESYVNGKHSIHLAQAKHERGEQQDEEKMRRYLHRLLDHCLNSRSRHFHAIQNNLELLAFALYAVGEQPPEDLTAFLQTLLEEEEENSSDQTDPKKGSPPQKRRIRHAG